MKKNTFFAVLLCCSALLWQCGSKVDFTINPDDNYIPVQISDTWGFITNTGDYLIYPKFDEVMPFSEGLAAVCAEEKWGFIDTMGRVIIEPQYDEVTQFSEGKAFVLDKQGEFKCIDTKGSVIFPLPDAQTCTIFRNGTAQITVAGHTQYIDAKGNSCQAKTVIPTSSSTNNGLTISQGADGKFGYVNAKGKFVIDAVYDAAADFKNHIAAVTVNEKIGFINRKGKMIIEPRYDASYPQCKHITTLTKDTLNVKGFVTQFIQGTTNTHFKNNSKAKTLQNLLSQGNYRVEAQALILNAKTQLTSYLTLTGTQYGFNEPIMKMNKNLTFNYKDGFNHTDDSLKVEYTEEPLNLHDVTYTFELSEGYLSIAPLLIKEFRNQLSNAMTTPYSCNNNDIILENEKMRVTIIAPISQSDNKLSIQVVFL